MLTPDGFKVLEFNCRMGDPETQAIIPLLDSDLCDILEACVEHRLQDIEIRWRPQSAVSVVMASEGYPGVTRGGEVILGIPEAAAAGCLVFQAGTKRMGEWLMTSGGRVLAVTGIADTLGDAAQSAYTGVEKVTFNGAHFRADIAR
jgi:phosphoribosylamine--glycine ligase